MVKDAQVAVNNITITRSGHFQSSRRQRAAAAAVLVVGSFLLILLIMGGSGSDDRLGGVRSWEGSSGAKRPAGAAGSVLSDLVGIANFDPRNPFGFTSTQASPAVSDVTYHRLHASSLCKGVIVTGWPSNGRETTLCGTDTK